MLKFELNIADRKTLANRMEELTGIHPYYTRAPLYAYDIGNYTIDRDGNLLVESENADAELLTTLLNEGLIRGCESIESTDDQPENTEPTENLAEEPVAEAEPDDTEEDEPDAEEIGKRRAAGSRRPARRGTIGSGTCLPNQPA